MPADRVVRATWIGAGVFVAAVVAAVVHEPAAVVAATVSVVLFVIGCAAFVTGFLRGVRRSRAEHVEMIGLFFLAGTAPAAVRRSLLIALAVEVAVAAVGAGSRPFTELAFAVLAPVHALGLMAWWGGTNGEFPPRSNKKDVHG